MLWTSGAGSLAQTVSGACMEREVFILPTGTSFLAWDVEFSKPQQHVETKPVSHCECDGRISRNGTLRITIETSQVKFRACVGSLAVGQQGQLSSVGDQFVGVTVSAIKAAGDHALISGQASRRVDTKLEWDR